MPQIHYQQSGLFHVVTKTAENAKWCTQSGIPDRLIHHLCLTRDVHAAFLHAFCILPNHLHLIVSPGNKGLSAFMQTFKSNSTKDIRLLLQKKIGWQAGFYDERICDEKQQSTALWYVLGNAMKHHLVKEMENWPWTSLHFSSICDPLGTW